MGNHVLSVKKYLILKRIPNDLIGVHRGFKPEAFSYLTALKPVFSLGKGAGGIASTTKTITTKNQVKDLLKISPAETVSVPLIKGDLVKYIKLQ